MKKRKDKQPQAGSSPSPTAQSLAELATRITLTERGFRHGPEDSARLVQLYAQGRWDELAGDLLKTLQVLNQETFLDLPAPTQVQVDEFVACLLFLLSRPDFELRDPHAVEFIRQSPLIANLVALSAFKTSDAFLTLLLNQQNNLIRLLSLYSPRNTKALSLETLFQANPTLVSLWYCRCFGLYYSACVEESPWRRLQDHMAHVDPNFTYLEDFHVLYYAASYIDPAREAPLKGHINRLVRESHQHHRFHNQPNPRRVAVLSKHWRRGHSVHRNQFPWLQALRGDYELVLFNLGPLQPDTDTSLFSEVHQLTASDNQLSLTPLKQNDFIMAYYPEVGMAAESILLANLRIAPIQVTSYGHSVSTFGAEIDYWIGGADVEKPDLLEQNYSERMVLIPGLGIANVPPAYQPKGLARRTDRLIINCAWAPQKVNRDLVDLLRSILERSPQHALLRFFFATGLEGFQQFLPFARSLTEALGSEKVEIMPTMPYQHYMERMEEGTLALDSYHYGGCNTVVDSLHIGRTIATLSGDRWYNRIGGAILRQAGLPELVATSPQEFVDLSARLINDAPWRESLEARLKATDLEAVLYNRPEDGRDFKRAIDYLVVHHEELKSQGSRKPITLGPA